ncbi:unnamed protein product [Orchesella dallaii]|uniref:Uncharacterized protein n=1 Tax=Orchesella dallaii TaxID=48710 RepID=A0ABP1S274_9HEXA
MKPFFRFGQPIGTALVIVAFVETIYSTVWLLLDVVSLEQTSKYNFFNGSAEFEFFGHLQWHFWIALHFLLSLIFWIAIIFEGRKYCLYAWLTLSLVHNAVFITIIISQSILRPFKESTNAIILYLGVSFFILWRLYIMSVACQGLRRLRLKYNLGSDSVSDIDVCIEPLGGGCCQTWEFYKDLPGAGAITLLTVELIWNAVNLCTRPLVLQMFGSAILKMSLQYMGELADFCLIEETVIRCVRIFLDCFGIYFLFKEKLAAVRVWVCFYFIVFVISNIVAAFMIAPWWSLEPSVNIMVYHVIMLIDLSYAKYIIKLPVKAKPAPPWTAILNQPHKPQQGSSFGANLSPATPPQHQPLPVSQQGFHVAPIAMVPIVEPASVPGFDQNLASASGPLNVVSSQSSLGNAQSQAIMTQNTADGEQLVHVESSLETLTEGDSINDQQDSIMTVESIVANIQPIIVEQIPLLPSDSVQPPIQPMEPFPLLPSDSVQQPIILPVVVSQQPHVNPPLPENDFYSTPQNVSGINNPVPILPSSSSGTSQTIGEEAEDEVAFDLEQYLAQANMVLGNVNNPNSQPQTANDAPPKPVNLATPTEPAPAPVPTTNPVVPASPPQSLATGAAPIAPQQVPESVPPQVQHSSIATPIIAETFPQTNSQVVQPSPDLLIVSQPIIAEAVPLMNPQTSQSSQDAPIMVSQPAPETVHSPAEHSSVATPIIAGVTPQTNLQVVQSPPAAPVEAQHAAGTPPHSQIEQSSHAAQTVAPVAPQVTSQIGQSVQFAPVIPLMMPDVNFQSNPSGQSPPAASTVPQDGPQAANLHVGQASPAQAPTAGTTQPQISTAGNQEESSLNAEVASVPVVLSNNNHETPMSSIMSVLGDVSEASTLNQVSNNANQNSDQVLATEGNLPGQSVYGPQVLTPGPIASEILETYNVDSIPHDFPPLQQDTQLSLVPTGNAPSLPSQSSEPSNAVAEGQFQAQHIPSLSNGHSGANNPSQESLPVEISSGSVQPNEQPSPSPNEISTVLGAVLNVASSAQPSDPLPTWQVTPNSQAMPTYPTADTSAASQASQPSQILQPFLANLFSQQKPTPQSTPTSSATPSSPDPASQSIQPSQSSQPSQSTVTSQPTQSTLASQQPPASQLNSQVAPASQPTIPTGHESSSPNEISTVLGNILTVSGSDPLISQPASQTLPISQQVPVSQTLPTSMSPELTPSVTPNTDSTVHLGQATNPSQILPTTSVQYQAVPDNLNPPTSHYHQSTSTLDQSTGSGQYTVQTSQPDSLAVDHTLATQDTVEDEEELDEDEDPPFDVEQYLAQVALLLNPGAKPPTSGDTFKPSQAVTPATSYTTSEAWEPSVPLSQSQTDDSLISHASILSDNLADSLEPNYYPHNSHYVATYPVNEMVSPSLLLDIAASLEIDPEAESIYNYNLQTPGSTSAEKITNNLNTQAQETHEELLYLQTSPMLSISKQSETANALLSLLEPSELFTNNDDQPVIDKSGHRSAPKPPNMIGRPSLSGMAPVYSYSGGKFTTGDELTYVDGNTTTIVSKSPNALDYLQDKGKLPPPSIGSTMAVLSNTMYNSYMNGSFKPTSPSVPSFSSFVMSQPHTVPLMTSGNNNGAASDGSNSIVSNLNTTSNTQVYEHYYFPQESVRNATISIYNGDLRPLVGSIYVPLDDSIMAALELEANSLEDLISNEIEPLKQLEDQREAKSQMVLDVVKRTTSEQSIEIDVSELENLEISNMSEPESTAETEEYVEVEELTQAEIRVAEKIGAENKTETVIEAAEPKENSPLIQNLPLNTEQQEKINNTIENTVNATAPIESNNDLAHSMGAIAKVQGLPPPKEELAKATGKILPASAETKNSHLVNDSSLPKVTNNPPPQTNSPPNPHSQVNSPPHHSDSPPKENNTPPKQPNAPPKENNMPPKQPNTPPGEKSAPEPESGPALPGGPTLPAAPPPVGLPTLPSPISVPSLSSLSIPEPPTLVIAPAPALDVPDIGQIVQVPTFPQAVKVPKPQDDKSTTTNNKNNGKGTAAKPNTPAKKPQKPSPVAPESPKPALPTPQQFEVVKPQNTIEKENIALPQQISTDYDNSEDDVEDSSLLVVEQTEVEDDEVSPEALPAPHAEKAIAEKQKPKQPLSPSPPKTLDCPCRDNPQNSMNNKNINNNSGNNIGSNYNPSKYNPETNSFNGPPVDYGIQVDNSTVPKPARPYKPKRPGRPSYNKRPRPKPMDKDTEKLAEKQADNGDMAGDFSLIDMVNDTEPYKINFFGWEIPIPTWASFTELFISLFGKNFRTSSGEFTCDETNDVIIELRSELDVDYLCEDDQGRGDVSSLDSNICNGFCSSNGFASGVCMPQKSCLCYLNEDKNFAIKLDRLDQYNSTSEEKVPIVSEDVAESGCLNCRCLKTCQSYGKYIGYCSKSCHCGVPWYNERSNSGSVRGA